MAEHHGLEHLRLRQLLGLRLHHHHSVLSAGYDQVKRAFLHLVDHRIEHQLAADKADARRRNGAEERNAGKRQRGRGRNHAEDVGVIFHVVGEHGDDDLRLVLEALYEQRSDGPVDQARGQRLFLRRASFTLEKTARNLAGGVRFLLIVDGQGEEVDARPRGLGGNDGGKNTCLAILGVDGRVGLARHLAGLECQLSPTPFNFHTMDVEHVRSFVQSGFIHFLAARSKNERQ